MRFIGSAKLIGLLTLFSRILGLGREILCASIFGVGLIWDAFLIAFLIPNLFRRIFGEGALTAAFVPVFVENLEKKGKSEAFRLLNIILTTFGLILILCVIIGLVVLFFLPIISRSPKLVLICEMLRIMMPYLILICLAAILGAALNSMNHFLSPALAPILFNVIWILTLLVSVHMFGGDKNTQIFVVCFGVVVGGVVQLAVQVPALLRRGMKFVPIFEPKNKTLTEIYGLFLPVVFGLSIYQVNELMDYVIAQVCISGDGAVSSLGYASRLMQLPLSVIGTAIATAVFPLLSSKLATEKKLEFSRIFQKSMNVSLYIAIPAGMGIIFLAEPIVALLFERGNFTPLATHRVAMVLAFYSLGIWAYSGNQILMRAFYAQKDAKTPVKIGIYTVLLNFVANILLVWQFKERGIALSTAISGIVNFCVLMIILRKRFPQFELRSIVISFIKSVFASLIMGCASILVLRYLVPAVGIPACYVFLRRLMDVLLPLGAGVLTYFLLGIIFKRDELKELLGKENEY